MDSIDSPRIGAACAHQLAEKGVHLALTYSTNLEAMNGVADELKAKYSAADNSCAIRISTHQVDVASAEQIQDMFVQIDKQHGQRPDILVSNAGYGKRIPNVWDISLEEFDHTITVNLRASFILVKGVVEHMKSQHWGRIVFMSSIAAYGGGINGCRKLLLPINLALLMDERIRRVQRRLEWDDEESVDAPGSVQHQCERRGAGDDR